MQKNGNGIQSVYLTEVPAVLAEVLGGLIGQEATVVIASTGATETALPAQAVNADVEVWEQHLENMVQNDPGLPATDRQALIIARRGQGLFKERVMLVERRCRITLVENSSHLVASHTKPWRDSNNDERLDGENGLLLNA